MSGNPYEKIDRFVAEGRGEEVLRTRATYSHGTKADLPHFYRFVILDTVFDPTSVDEKKLSYWEHTIGVANMQFAKVLPRNTVIARRVLDATSSATESPMFLFPFFPPNLALPCQPGEHIWVMFEAPGSIQTDLGYWFCRITEPGFVEDVNHVHSPRAYDPSFHPGIKDVYEGKDDPKYEFRNGRAATKDGERYTEPESATLPGDDKAYETLMKDTDAGKLMKYEAVPRYRKRPGEFVLEGTNNALISVGRDRVGPVAKYSDDAKKGKVPSLPDEDDPSDGSGSIDLVAGRGQTDKTLGKTVTNSIGKKELAKAHKDVSNTEGDPDFKNDRSRVLISQHTLPDKNFEIADVVEIHTKSAVKDGVDGFGAIVVKSDKIRFIARKDIVILVTGAKETDADGNVLDVDASAATCASIIIKTNGEIILTPAKLSVIKLGGEDANMAIMCTKVNNMGAGGQVIAQPIIDTWGGVQGAADGLNGTFARKVLIK